MKTTFLTGVRLAVAAGAFALALPASAASLASAPSPCDNATSTTPFLTATERITNDPDSGDHGNWALDAFTENISVWLGTDHATYCANANTTDGTFVTTAGPSPKAGVTIPAGITGTFTGGENYILPSTLTLGSTTSATGTQSINFGSSATDGFSAWVNKVFTNAGTGSSYVQTYSLTYTADNPASGSWIDSDPLSGGNDTGDIVNATSSTVYVDQTSGSDTNVGSKSYPFQTLPAALAAVADGGTIILASDYTENAAFTISKAVTLDGQGHTLHATFAKTDNSNNAAIMVEHNDVTIEDLTEDGTGSTNLHGINIYEASNVLLDGVTVEHNAHTGVNVDGATVTVNNLHTIGDGWDGVDVDQGSGVTSPASLTVNGISYHDEASTSPAIFVDDTAKSVSVTDTNGQYTVTNHDMGGGVTSASYALAGTHVQTTSSSEQSGSSQSVSVTLTIPAGAVIVGDSSWNGTVSAPSATTTSFTLPGYTTLVTSAIAVGSPTSDLTFDKAAKLVFAGQAGTHVGSYNHAGTFTEITASCTGADDEPTQTANLAAGAACKMNDGSDLVVWTKHFSTFISYKATANVSSSGSSSGGSSGGSSGSSVVTPAAPAATTPAAPTGRVLGEVTFKFNQNLSVGSQGTDVTALQNALTADGSYNGPITGFFGPLTKAGVMAYQRAHGISPVSGFVGPLTRAALNAASSATTAGASSQTNLQAQITALEAQIATLQAQLQAQTGK